LTDPWRAAEWFLSSDAEVRQEGLAALTTGDLLYSPLTIYLCATRIDEPELGLRRDIVAALGRCLKPDAPAKARDYLVCLLARFDRADVQQLLEAGEAPVSLGRFPAYQQGVALLLDRVPQLAGLLTRIAADRSIGMDTRLAAIAAVGNLGVLEALPALEGLRARIEGQAAGQLAMAFAPAPERDFGLLFSTVNAAINSLKENE
jgi:hypothetical protein